MKRPGGTQWWRDRVVVRDYRIQQHVRFSRVRVLDPDDRRIHTGTSYAAAHILERSAIARVHTPSHVFARGMLLPCC